MKKSSILWSFVTILVVLCGCSASDTSSKKIYLPCKIIKNGNWGFVTPNGEVICEDKFKNEPTAVLDSVFFVEEGQEMYSMYRLQENNPKLLLKDLTAYGTVVNGLVPVCKKGRGIEVVDTHGRTIFGLREIEGCRVMQCSPWFVDGYLLVIVVNESGRENIVFVDENGGIKRMPQEFKLTNFVSGNIFQVYDKTKNRLFVDREGRNLEWLEPFNRAYGYTYGIRDYVVCEQGRKIFIYTIDGKQVLECPSEIVDIELNGINEDFIIYKNRDWKEGVIDIKGNEILPAIYSDVIYLNHGFLAEKDYKEWLLFDEAGREQRRFNNYFEIKEVEGFGYIASSNIYNEDGIEHENYWEDYWVVLNNCEPVNDNKFYRISDYPRQGADFIIFSIPTHTDWEEMGLKGKVKELRITHYEAEKISDGDYIKGKMESQEIISFSKEGLKKKSIQKHNEYGSYQTEYSYLDDTIYMNIVFSEDYWDKRSSNGKWKEVKKYDDFGNLVLHSQYNGDGRKTQEKIWQYNDENHLVKYDKYGTDDKLLASETWEYDDNNLLIMHTKQGASEEYDEYGEPIDRERCEKNFEYDDQGRVQKYDVYSLDGKFLRTVHYDSDGHKIDVDGNVTKTFDEAGRLVSIVSKDYNNEIFFKDNRTYNDDGKLILQVQESLDKYTYTVPTWNKEIWEYLYKYDYRGNVVSEILDHVITEEGTHLCSITEYNIVYYE